MSLIVLAPRPLRSKLPAGFRLERVELEARLTRFKLFRGDLLIGEFAERALAVTFAWEFL